MIGLGNSQEKNLILWAVQAALVFFLLMVSRVKGAVHKLRYSFASFFNEPSFYDADSMEQEVYFF